MRPPWYRATVQQDRERLREIDALRQGLECPRPADRQAAVRAALMPAGMCDADVFRAMLAERVLELARDAEPTPPAGPDREQLLTLLA